MSTPVLALKESDIYILIYDFTDSLEGTCIFQTSREAYIMVRSIVESLGFRCEIPSEIYREDRHLLQFHTTYPVQRYNALTNSVQEFIIESETITMK